MKIIRYGITDSTNTRAKEYIKEHAPARALFVANGQTEGRGRLGRSFYSPESTGIYMTYAFKTDASLADTVRITTAAAVAVARAIDADVRIKWVNDLYLDGKKVCGILTEAVNGADGRLSHIIIGIGINVTTDIFPDDISDKAGAIGDTDKDALINRICKNLSAIADDIGDTSYLAYYRKHMLWQGERIMYTENNEGHEATVIGVDDFGGLIVEQDGNQKILRSGEISIKK